MGLSPTSPRRSARLVLAALVVLTGCETKPDPASSEGPKPAPSGQAEAYTPIEPSPGRFVAKDGRIAVPIPGHGDEDSGWECLEERNPKASAEGGAAALRCRRTNPRELMFMAAKTHRQPPDQRTNAKTVLMTLYREDNINFFDTVEYTHDGPATLAGVEGYEAELIAEHGRLGAVRKRERLAIVGDRILAVSAEGLPELWDEHQAAIDQWFAEVEFALAP